MRVYLIERDYQPAEIDVADIAGKFATWLIDDANPALSEVIQRWLWQPPDRGGLGALAESIYDVAVLRAEVIASWTPDAWRENADAGEGR